MSNTKADIYDYEVRNLVNKLIRFIGRKEINKCLDRYSKSLQLSGPIFREYYLRERHPWWNPFVEYFKVEKAGKSIKKNLTTEIKYLAGDAKKISVLQKLMPESVMQKYRKDLIDDERAYDYLFEIQIAWHYYLKGYNILWHENDFTPHSEFLVKAPDFEFNVECKRISTDASRRIRRRDFYRLAEKFIPCVEKRGYSGVIDITINDRLHGNDGFINDLSSQIITEINAGHIQGSFQIPFGCVTLDLKTASGIVVDISEHFKKFLEKKSPKAHGAIFAKSLLERPVDPIELTLMSQKSDNILNGIKDKINKAAKIQLDKSKPGLITCFLEGTYDFTELATDSGLQSITSILLGKEDFSHIAVISYCSESIIDRLKNTETFFSHGLIYRNPNCKFGKAKDFPFLSSVK